MREWKAGWGKVRDRQSGDGNVGKFGVVRWSRKGEGAIGGGSEG